jgi:branched-chain amino acid transport system substrate-binding protein
LSATLSGSGLAPFGIDIQRGVELALEDRPFITVDGQSFPVRLEVQDDLCSADGGQAVASRFAAAGNIAGVIGPMCSSGCRAAAPIFDAAGYTSISPSCTAAFLTSSRYESFNRAIVSDAFQGVVAANFIFDTLGVARIAVIHDGSPYGDGLARAVSREFVRLGGEVVLADAVNTGESDFRALLEDIRQENPQLIYFAGFAAEASRLVDQRADVGLENVLMMGADGIRTQEFIRLALTAAEGVYASSALPADSEPLINFLARYEARYGEPPPAPFHANAYDAYQLLLNAIEASASVQPDGRLIIDRAAVARYMRSFSGYNGLTGLLNADGTGETSTASIAIARVQDGVFVEFATGRVDADRITITRRENG